MKITFGKWRGTELQNVEPGYLAWLASQDIRHGGVNWSEQAREYSRASKWSGVAGCVVTQDERDAASEEDRFLAEQVEEDQALFDAQLRADAATMMAAYRTGTPMRPSEIAARGLAFVQRVLRTTDDRATHAYCVLLTLAGLSIRACVDEETINFEMDAYKRIAEEIRNSK